MSGSCACTSTGSEKSCLCSPLCSCSLARPPDSQRPPLEGSQARTPHPHRLPHFPLYRGTLRRHSPRCVGSSATSDTLWGSGRAIPVWLLLSWTQGQSFLVLLPCMVKKETVLREELGKRPEITVLWGAKGLSLAFILLSHFPPSQGDLVTEDPALN